MALDRWIALVLLGICLVYGYTAFFTMDEGLAPFARRNPVWPSTFPKVLSVFGACASLLILLGFEKDNVAKMNEIAKLKMELAQNVSKLIDYEYRLDEKTNNTTTSIPDIKNKSNKNTTEEVFMNEEIMKSRITELEEENADLQKRLMASPSAALSPTRRLNRAQGTES